MVMSHDLPHLLFFHPQGRDAYERRFEGREGMGRYYAGKFKKCYNCKQKGHMDKECPHPKVSIWFRIYLSQRLDSESIHSGNETG